MTAPLNQPPSAEAVVERMTTSEVLALARISRATLWRRVRCGRLPAPTDQGRQALFLKSAVIAALSAEADRRPDVAVAIEQRLEQLRRRRRKGT